jgi:hypothetical protein
VAGCSDPYATSRSHQIQGGAPEPGQPAVGLLEFSTGNFGTGTLISPTVVLTAGHVTYGDITGFYLGPGKPSPSGPSFEASAGMRKVPILDKIDHPSYKCVGTACDEWGTLRLDIGVVHLAEPIFDIPPEPLGSAAPAIGWACTTVGYGEYDITDADVPIERELGAPLDYWLKQKRSCDVTISQVGLDLITTKFLTGIADGGDSGGPLFCDGKLVGTVAYHTDGDWPDHRVEAYTRVLPAQPWIEDRLAEWAVASPDSTAPSVDASVYDAAMPAAVDDDGCSFVPARASSSVGLVLGFVAIVLLRRRRA